MMLFIAIDGACRRNGKPDCTAAGGVYIQQLAVQSDTNAAPQRVASKVLSAYEYKSTNQRGELLALLKALDYIYSANLESIVVTDSEYIFNAMTKSWYTSWINNSWLTRAGDPVKNSDIWREIARTMQLCESKGIDITFHHIKGHCIPFGRVTADNALDRDKSGELLHWLVDHKYDEVAGSKKKVFDAAQDISLRNNGFTLNEYLLKEWVVANVVADAIATKVVEAADSHRET